MLKLKYHTDLIECGTDEAGRGCLAGPVTAAAVMLPDNFLNDILTDSKQLSEKKRELLKPIIEQEAIAFGICHVMMEEIDEINILNASILGMHRSIEGMIGTLSRKQKKPQHILVDGNRFKPFPDIDHTTVIKGDGKYLPIAAASILAKTARDHFMERIHEEYPMYNWKKNKGYPTKEHRQAIRDYGITKYHRRSFRLLPEQYSFDFDIFK
ncbi:ribonuclease HII [Dokdonia sinensis]|uniref:Ribonuclease HII n=1 Tax=Dokdonia sinensis TaxID=2479847 RepID=A0A3M0G6L0_9FLAO|nr:ribonuclease HII [Dokdonia sinensis]RMB56729.1 ribonuclease HII [Dokdonia sinensis]